MYRVIQKVLEAHGRYYIILRHTVSYYVILEWSGV